MLRPSEFKKTAIWFVAAVSLLLCVLQVVKNAGTKVLTQENELATYAYLVNTSQTDQNETVTLPPLECALLSLAAMEMALTKIQSNMERMENFYISSVLPALLDIQRQLKYMGVDDYERARVDKILKICAAQVDDYCAVLKDDLKSLLIDVQFIISDITSNIDNVVPSSFSTMRTFMKDFDLSFSRNKIGVQRSAFNVNAAIIRAMQDRENDARATEVRATLSVLTGDLKSELDDVINSKLKYDVIKGNAARDLNQFITSY